MKSTGFFILFYLACIQRILSQGCSDAGICTLPFLKPDVKENITMHHQLQTGLTIGLGEESVFGIDPFVGYRFKTGPYSLDTKVTYGIHSGNGVSASDFGDFYLINNYAPSERLTLSAGLKFPLSGSEKNKLLPMAYQPSLGTLDILAGVSYQFPKWHLALAIQSPVKTIHENAFSPVTDPSSPFVNFTDTRSFKRKADVLLRISRPIVINEKLTFTPGLLPIYHIDEDEFKTESNADFMDIDCSEGLTLNAFLSMHYFVNERNTFSSTLGFPLIVRQIRPDGLTRSFVIGVDYTFSF